MANISLRIAGLWFGLAALGASAVPELDYRNPIAGEKLELFVGHATPYAWVDIVVLVNGNPIAPETKLTDGSGFARFELPLPVDAVDKRFTITALERRTQTPSRSVDIDIVAPSLLISGRENGEAVLYRIPVEPRLDAQDGASSPLRMERMTRKVLGSGQPGGAVRDGHSTKTFVIADAEIGRVRVLEDDVTKAEITPLDLTPDLRGIAISPDGRTVLVTAAGGRNGNGELILIPTSDPSVRTRIDLGYPLGVDGGRNIVVSEDGTRAFVALDGAFLRDVNLVALETGSKLFAVGTPGRDHVRDLRIVGDQLVALTGHADPAVANGAYSGVDITNPQRTGYYRTSSRESKFDLGSAADGRLALFVLEKSLPNGVAGEITVIDVATMSNRGSFAVPSGADALLLTPNPRSTRAALLYGAGTADATLRPLDLATHSVDVPHALGYPAQELAVQGSSTSVSLFFLKDATGRMRALRASDLVESTLPITIDIAAISICQ